MTRADVDRVRRLGATPETRRAAAEALHALDALEIRLAIDADPLAGVEDDELPDGAALPWEYDVTPCTRRSRFDAPVSPERMAQAVLS